MSSQVVTPTIPTPSSTTQTLTISSSDADLKAAMTTEPPAQVTPPVETPAPAWGEVKDLGEGKFSTKLKTGETFEGTAVEVISKLGEAKVNTREWAEGEIAKAKQAPTVIPAQQPTAVLTPQGWKLDNAEFAAKLFENPADGFIMAMAAATNSTPEEVKAFLPEMMNAVGAMRKSEASAAANDVTMAFLGERQDFPNTPEATEALFGVLAEMGIPDGVKVTPKLLSAGLDEAIRSKKITPLTAEQIQATTANRPGTHRPAPVLPVSSSAPVNTTPQQPNISMTNEELLAMMKSGK